MQKLVWVPFFTSKALDNTAWHVAVQTDSQLRRSWVYDLTLYFIGKSSFLCQMLLQRPKNSHIREVKLAFPVTHWKKRDKLILAPLLTYKCSKIQSLNSNLRRHEDLPKGVMVEFFPLPHPTHSRASPSILSKYWEQTVIKPLGRILSSVRGQYHSCNLRIAVNWGQLSLLPTTDPAQDHGAHTVTPGLRLYSTTMSFYFVK